MTDLFREDKKILPLLMLMALAIGLAGCAAETNVPNEATAPNSPLVREYSAAVPPPQFGGSRISPNPDPPPFEPKALEASSYPTTYTDDQLDEIMDGNYLESEGKIPTGPMNRVDRYTTRITILESDIIAPPGYAVDTIARSLSFPVDIAFSDTGEIYVAEAGGNTIGTSPEAAPPARILQLLPFGGSRIVYDKQVSIDDIKAHDSSADMPEGLIPPITGLTWHDGKLYVSHRSRYSVLDLTSGEFKTIVNGLPSWGPGANSKPIFDPQGRMVWHVSTQTNAGVIDEQMINVIRDYNKPEAHDIPGEEIALRGVNFESPTEPQPGHEVKQSQGEYWEAGHPVPEQDQQNAQQRQGQPNQQANNGGQGNQNDQGKVPTKPTGVYMPLGEKSENGQTITGEKICNGAFYRCKPDGTNIELIAWGFHSCFGYRYSSDGKLIATENSVDPISPRGIRNSYESIYEVVDGEWYGWPDFFSGIPITDDRFEVIGGNKEFVLTDGTHKRLLQNKAMPRQPLARLPEHSGAEGMVFGRKEFGLSKNHILVAEFGSLVPLYLNAVWPPAGPGPAVPAPGPELGLKLPWPGFRVSLVNIKTGKVIPFLINKTGRPASALGSGGLERPVQLEWGPDGSLYVVDYGTINTSPGGLHARPYTGVIWRVEYGGKQPPYPTLTKPSPTEGTLMEGR